MPRPNLYGVRYKYSRILSELCETRYKVLEIRELYATRYTSCRQSYMRFDKEALYFSSPATRHGGALGESMYSSYSFTTSTLDGVSGQRHAPDALYPRGKDIRQEAGWAPEPVWTQRLQEKSFASAGDRNADGTIHKNSRIQAELYDTRYQSTLIRCIIYFQSTCNTFLYK
jgi:hypothetical protein